MEENMEETRKVSQGEIYKHFKGGLYQVITIGEAVETGEGMVVYQALFGKFKIYVQPYEAFISKVERRESIDTKQIYCYELYDIRNQEEKEVTGKKQPEIIEDKTVAIDNEQHKKEEQENIPQQVFLAFLDAETYEEKLEFLSKMHVQLDDRLLNNIAAALDISLEQGTIEEKFETIKFHLSTYAKFECRRLR